MDVSFLARTNEPHVHVAVATSLEIVNVLWTVERQSSGAIAARFLRGRKAVTKSAFFDECAAALQFPPYFGENWDALHDCLTDLSWLRAEARTLCVLDAVHLLERSGSSDLETLRAVMQDVFKKWNDPARPHLSRPFHLMLHADVADEKPLRARWLKAGWKLPR